MANQSLLTDDAVAARLIQEAEHSLRFSSYGMDPSGPRPEHKPKPNTRFLRNIIRTTESHNAALLAKEAAESQARLQELSDAEEKTRQRRRPDPSEMRRRQMGNISAILLGAKRKRNGDEDLTMESRHRDERKIDEHRSSKTNGHQDSEEGEEDYERHKRRRRHTDRTDDEKCRHRERRRDRDRKSRGDDSPGSSRRRHRESRPEKESTRHRRRSQSPESSERHQRRSRRDRSRARSSKHDSTSRKKSISSRKGRHSDEEEDCSDPLEDAIGPAPPQTSIKARGRGAISQESGIDARFSTSYNPASDLHHGPAEGEQWDYAVETFRDRQKWKAQGADRLRAAGFTDDQIKNWEKSERSLPGGVDADVNIEDMRWVKKGEQRAWDLGKRVNKDGTMSYGPDWAK